MIIAEVVRQMRGDLLLTWLKPHELFLAKEGWLWPAVGAAGALDLEHLTEILFRPGRDLPEALGHSLFLISEMATSGGMDLLLRERTARGWDSSPDGLITPAELAVETWLEDPALLEQIHACQEMNRPRAFSYFATLEDPPPAFPGPTAEHLAALERRLTHFHVAWRRGCGTRVFCRHMDRRWWFLVRHGAPFRREGALEDGRPTSVCYRPRKHDVLVYDPARGELGVNCCAPRERVALLRAFGSCLFGRANFFPDVAKYTLAPIVRHGRDCLACADIPGLERVALTEVEFYFREHPWKRVIHKADDIFRLVDHDELEWPNRLEHLARATFEVKFRRATRPRQLTIVPCNKALYGRDSDTPLLEQWLQARCFIDERTTN